MSEEKTLVPQSGEEDISKRLDGLKEEAQQYRSQFEKDWQEYERFYYSKHWKAAQRRPVKNWIFSIIEAEVPILTDSRPSVDVLPLEAENVADAKILEAGIHSVLDAERLMVKQTQAVRSALITGNGWLYVDYDPDKERGDGNVTLKNVGWRHVWVDPKANEIDEADYAIIEFPADVAELKRRFPEKADLIKPTGKGDMVKYTNIREDGTDSDRWSPDINGDRETVGRYNSERVAVAQEIWFKDYTMTDIPQEETDKELLKEREELVQGINPDVYKYEDHEQHITAHKFLKLQIVAETTGKLISELTDDDVVLAEQDEELSLVFAVIDDHIEAHEALKEQNPRGQKPKYKDNLRLVIRVDKEIIFDGSHPEGDGKIPLVQILCYKTEDSIYGFGEVKNILSAQKSYNELDWSEFQGLRLTGNSGWIVDEESGVDTDTLTNEPGLVVKKKIGTEARRLEPGVVSPQFGSTKETYRFSIEAISGINEATQGRRPTGITAASAIKFLQEQSVGRIRLKTRYLEEYSMPRLGELIAARIVNHWTVEKKLRVFDANGRIQFVEFDPETVQKLRYDVRAVPGSTAGLDKESIFAVMKELVQAGLIDQRTFFEVTDVPYKARLLERLEENDEQAALLEQLALENEELKVQLEEVLQIAEQSQLTSANPVGSA